MSTKTVRRTETRAILAQHVAAINKRGRRMISDAIEIGRRLKICREIVGHGNWLPWLKREFGWTDRTARNFIHLHDMHIAKSEIISDLTDLGVPLTSMYALAAPQTPTEAVAEVLERAKTGKRYSTSDVRDVIKRYTTERMAFPEKRYTVILCDPPWKFTGNSERPGWRGPERHYPTMELDGIKALPVKSLAAPDSVLFLWVTSPKLHLGLEVMQSWGFTYKTVAFVWVKTTENNDLFTGMEWYTRQNTEFVLLGTKGDIPEREDKAVHQVVFAPRMAHSRKPDEVHERIDQLYGDVPKIELFARRQYPGWKVWVNQVGLAAA
jgi:N6-adenosine-specific RNA methylase IME4